MIGIGWGQDDDDDSNEDDDVHACTEHNVINELCWTPVSGPTATDDGIAVTFQQEVQIECVECGNQRIARDQSVEKRRTVEYDTEETWEPEVDSRFVVEVARGELYLD